MSKLLPHQEQNAETSTNLARIQQALSELAEPIASLNRRYVEQVSARSLVIAQQAESWIGQAVDVFLRHDRVRVFCVYDGQNFAMADFVTLNDVEFRVDMDGYRQTLVEQGPLPNHRTVHAYLHGTLRDVSDEAQQVPDGWTAVRYNPLESNVFFRTDTQEPVHSATSVFMVPGPDKVWVPADELSQGTTAGERQ